MDTKTPLSSFSPHPNKPTLFISSSLKDYHTYNHHIQSDFHRNYQNIDHSSYDNTFDKNPFQQPPYRKNENLKKPIKEAKIDNEELILTDTGYHSKLFQRDASKMILQQNRKMRNQLQQNEWSKNRIVKKFSVLFEQYLKQINLHTFQQKAKDIIKLTKNKKLQYQNFTIQKLFDICVDMIFTLTQQYKKMQKQYQILSIYKQKNYIANSKITDSDHHIIKELKFQIKNLNQILQATENQKANTIKKTKQILQNCGNKKLKKNLNELQVQNEVLLVKLKQYQQKYEKQVEQITQYKLQTQQKYMKMYEIVKKMKINEKTNSKAGKHQ